VYKFFCERYEVSDMKDFSKDLSYIKGYADGLKIGEKSSEGKVILKLIDIISHMADEIKILNKKSKDFERDIEDIADIVDELEEVMYQADLLDNDYDFDDDYNDDDDDDDYDDDDEDDELFDEFDDDDDMGHFEIQCPHCKEDVMIDFETLDMDRSIICPNCHGEIELDFEYECDCDDCNHEFDDDDDDNDNDDDDDDDDA